MAKEVEWQTRIAKKIRLEGGFADKWSNAFKAGPPDLIAILPEVVFIEDKVERKWDLVRPRTLELTPIQKAYLHNINDAQGVAVVLCIIEPFGQRKSVYFSVHAAPETPSDVVKIKPDLGQCYKWLGPKSGENLSEYIRETVRRMQ